MEFFIYGITGFLLITGAGYFFLKKTRDHRSGPDLPVSLKEALSKTRKNFWGKLKTRFSDPSIIDPKELVQLEEALYTSDLGPKTVGHLMERISQNIQNETPDLNWLRDSLKREINFIFQSVENKSLETNSTHETNVWMMVGVNGAGKTTTIGKLAGQNAALGKKVLIAAGDTFRAAADEQLKTWADRAEVELFNPKGLKDPSALAFDAIQKAVAKKFDLVIVDTAGRLHTQKNLMEELKKMKRVMGKVLAEAPHETLLVLDANSGQNALNQTKQFHQALQISGVILTKMDSSAKGGVAVGVSWEHRLPIRMIGVGEGIHDLRPFDPKEFVNSIL